MFIQLDYASQYIGMILITCYDFDNNVCSSRYRLFENVSDKDKQ
jgi:hypothetical protein